MAKVLLIDDEMTMLQMVGELLRADGHQVIPFTNTVAAVDRLSAVAPDLVLAHLSLDRKRTAGGSLLQKARSFNPPALVIMILSSGSLDVAVESMKRGAYDYITKPFTVEELKLRVQRALSHQAALSENRRLRKQAQPEAHSHEIIGRSGRIQDVLKEIEVTAESDGAILLCGDPGTGKQLLGRAIHLKSRRRFSPFVPLSCKGPSEHLLEAELFGDGKGSNGGTAQERAGVLRQAEGGTVFLRDIAYLPAALQGRLLEALQTRAILPPGETRPISFDVRILAGTSQPLEHRVADGSFLRELYTRLSEFKITVPNLRERPDDIPLLVDHFLKGKIHSRSGKPFALCPDALELCRSYAWPGNVLEVQIALEQACMVCQDGTIQRGDFPRAVQQLTPPAAPAAALGAQPHHTYRPSTALSHLAASQDANASDPHHISNGSDDAPVSLKKFLRDQEITYLQRTLAHAGGSKERAAELLGISLATIYRKLSEPQPVEHALYRGNGSPVVSD